MLVLAATEQSTTEQSPPIATSFYFLPVESLTGGLRWNSSSSVLHGLTRSETTKPILGERILMELKQSNYTTYILYLDASSYLYKRPCPSVGLSVRSSVRPFVRSMVRPLVMVSSKSVENGLFRISNGLGRGGRRDEKEEVTKKEQGGE